MTEGSPSPVLFPRLLAAGHFEDVLAAPSNPEPTLLACGVDGGGVHGRLWDIPRGIPAGPRIAGEVDGLTGAFGMGLDSGVARPWVVVEDGLELRVVDARSGAVVSRWLQGDSSDDASEVMCLAELRGATVVVSVSARRGAHPSCRVWEAGTGTLLNAFEVWYPRYYAFVEPALVAVPDVGDGAVLLTTQEERVEDSGWPHYVYDRPYLVLLDLAGGGTLRQIDGGPPVALTTMGSAPVAVFCLPSSWDLAAVRFPGGDRLATFTVGSTIVLAAGRVAGRDVTVSGEWCGGTAVVRELHRPDPLAVIAVPGLHGAAVAADGSIALATPEGLFAVAPGAVVPGR